MSDPYLLAEEAATILRARTGVDRVDLALVLGSGWAAAADMLGETVAVLPLAELRLLTTAAGRMAAVLTGRTHFYEGRGVAPAVHGVRTMAAAGATTVVLTNGCGGLNPDQGPGTVVLIRDHLNLTGATPLVGARFVDLSAAYSPRLRALAHGVDPELPEGVYAQFHGPQYETPAEVRMAQTLGADLVGMSTTLETIAAREAGMEVLGLSLVTNLAAGISPTPLDHAEVVAAGKAAAPRLQELLRGLVGVL